MSDLPRAVELPFVCCCDLVFGVGHRSLFFPKSSMFFWKDVDEFTNPKMLLPQTADREQSTAAVVSLFRWFVFYSVCTSTTGTTAMPRDCCIGTIVSAGIICTSSAVCCDAAVALAFRTYCCIATDLLINEYIHMQVHVSI